MKTIGGDVLAVRADVSKLSDLDKFYKAVAEKFGKVDVLSPRLWACSCAEEQGQPRIVHDQAT